MVAEFRLEDVKSAGAIFDELSRNGRASFPKFSP
jgi:hypothetical protein